MSKYTVSSNYNEVIVFHNVDQRDRNWADQIEQTQQQQQQQQQQNGKRTQGICLLFLSAFLFSFMGMFLQFTGRMGLPSTELVFIRSTFQGAFVLFGMVIFRFEDSSSHNASKSNEEGVRVDGVEICNHDNLEGGGVGLVPLHEVLLMEEKKQEEEIGNNISPDYANEEASLLARSAKCTYKTLLTKPQEENFEAEPNPLSPLIIQCPFGTNPTMRTVVLLRGIIGGFGFMNYYYTLSTLPLGDATTLLSLYPIVTIFLARIVLGEEIKPLSIVAALFSVVGAALICRPPFLFGNEGEDMSQHKPPKLGYITAVVGSFCASGVIVLIRKAGKVGAHTLQLLFSWVIFGVFFSTIVGVFAGSTVQDQRWRMPAQQEVPYVLGVCVFGTGAHFLLNYSAKLVPANLAGLLRSSDIFWAYLLEMFVLSEQPQKSTWWGVLFVCASLGLILFASSEKANIMVKRLGSVGDLTATK